MRGIAVEQAMVTLKDDWVPGAPRGQMEGQQSAWYWMLGIEMMVGRERLSP
jgi:hypothetical protein